MHKIHIDTKRFFETNSKNRLTQSREYDILLLDGASIQGNILIG